MTTREIELEVRSLGMKLVRANQLTRAMVDAFDCMVGEFYARDRIGRETFFWAQEIVGRFQ